MTEFEIYRIKVRGDSGKSVPLYFYVRMRKGTYEAFFLGFPPQKESYADLVSKGRRLEYEERQARLAASRTMRMSETEVRDDNGMLRDPEWYGQAVLVELWRKMESLGFLKIPKNPFLGKRPPHDTIVDFDERLGFFMRIERGLKGALKRIRNAFAKGDE
jgi:hypothetical protein